MKTKLFFIISLIFFKSFSQSQTKRVLFLGNSYTYVNNLPQLLADFALAGGDTIIFDSNTPGGYTFQGHSTNATSLAKISAGNWDFVVLQEQSQMPSFPIGQVETDVFPYARYLDSMIHLQNPCAETVFYMTWGRKNGDASNCSFWPPVCTYEGMDSLLNLRYRMMADSNNTIISPVGAVWKYIRQNYPLIELYQSDASHPSVAGTFAAACSFYAALLRKDPTQINYNSSLTLSEASAIKNAAKVIVYDQLPEWHIGEYDPHANFAFSDNGGGTFSFTNSSLNATDYYWSFGDGNTSASANPTHTYSSSGTYNVVLTAEKCGLQDTMNLQVLVSTINIDDEKTPMCNIELFPNPANNNVTLKLNVDEVNKHFFIYDYKGSVVMNGKTNSKLTSINLSELNDGIYFLRLENNSNQFFKIVKTGN